MSPTYVSYQVLQQKIVDLEGIIIKKRPSLSKVYAVYSGGENKPRTEALAARLNRITTQLRHLEIQFSTPSLSFAGCGINILPLFPSFSST